MGLIAVALSRYLRFKYVKAYKVYRTGSGTEENMNITTSIGSEVSQHFSFVFEWY